MALSPTMALVASAGVVLAVILLWKLVKLAFRIALVVAAAVAVVFLLRQAGVL